MLMNVKETLVETGGSAQIWLQTIPVNAQGNIWEETASTVSTYSFFMDASLPVPFLLPQSIQWALY